MELQLQRDNADIFITKKKNVPAEFCPRIRHFNSMSTQAGISILKPSSLILPADSQSLQEGQNLHNVSPPYKKVIIIIISLGYLPSREAKLKKSAKNYFIRDNKLKNDRLTRATRYFELNITVKSLRVSQSAALILLVNEHWFTSVISKN